MKKRMPIWARLAVAMYQKWMGLVDRLDKNVSLSRLRLKRCIKRYHRAVFVWYIAIVLNNVMVLFGFLFHDIETFKKSKARLGFKHWFQNTLGNVLIEHGIRLAEDAWLNKASTIVTKFIRYSMKLLVKRRQAAATKAQQQSGRANVFRRVALRDQRNVGGGKRVGRPKKRNRGGGRRPNQVDELAHTHAYTYTHTHTQTSECTVTRPRDVTPPSASMQERVNALVFADPRPHFVPRSRGRTKAKCKPTREGILVGGWVSVW